MTSSNLKHQFFQALFSFVAFISLLQAQYTLQNEFCDTNTCDYITGGIYAIWWDAEYEYTSDAQELLEVMMGIRQVCLEELAMEDPPNPTDGYFYNIYIGNWLEDLFPDGWAVGQGTDSYGYPYLTLAIGAHLEPIYQYHEGFHIFQYNANSPGFSYSGYSAWFVEASANWFVSWMLPEEELAFLECAAIEANPHLPMWYDGWNAPPDDPQNWQRGVHPYAMNALLYFLTEEIGLPATVLSTGFYSGTDLLPQQYLAQEFGLENFRNIYADWSAHNAADFDYILPAQLDRARIELEDYGDPDDLHPVVAELGADGTGGQWYSPAPNLMLHGWSYHVYDLVDFQTGNLAFYLQGAELGSDGGAAAFRGRVVLQSGEGQTFFDLEQLNDQLGFLELEITQEVEAIRYVISAVPDHFTGNQTYVYEIRVEPEFILGDANLDGSVDILDIVITLNAIFAAQYDLRLDVNLDLDVNILDIIMLINIIVNG